MNIYEIFILSSLIIIIYNYEFCELLHSATKPDDCKGLAKADYSNHCCYFKGKWKGQVYSGCIDLTPVRYNEKDKYIKELNDQDGYDVEKIDCKSIYIGLNIFSMIIIFILLFS